MKKIIAAISVSGLMALSPLAMAGQHPDAAQRAALEQALTSAGYVTWGEVELDDCYWEVEDARKEPGAKQKYDLRLDPQTMQVVREKLDD